MFRTLPEVLVEQTGDGRIGELIASTVREIIALVDAATPGSQLMLGRLMEMLFVEVLRRHIARLPSGSQGWFAAINDPIVGRALAARPRRSRPALDRREPGARGGSSRTVLAERFNALLGRPPIDYVTSWRIQLAAERLRGTDAEHRQDRRRRRLRVGGRLQSRVQARHRRDAGTLARGVSPDPLAAKAPAAPASRAAGV